MMKRIISLLLILVILTGMLPIFAQAEEPETAVDNGEITVQGANGFGNLLAEDIAQAQETMEEQENAGYTLTELEITGNTATVTNDSLEETIAIFKADYYANNFDRQFDFENGSYARNYYEGLSNDKSFMNAVKAWEVLHIATDPLYSLESGMISMRDYYRVALFDILCVRTSLETTTTYVDKIYEEINNDYTNYLISCTAEMMGKQDISPSELKTLQLTEERKQLLLEGTGLGKVAGAADIASKILIGAKSCYDAVDLLSKYCAIRDLNDGTKEVLLAIANDVTNEDELRWAAQDCAECFEQDTQVLLWGWKTAL